MSKHKYVYYRCKCDIRDWKTNEEAPEGALLTAKEIEKRFPSVSKRWFSECLPMTTDDFYRWFGFRFEYGDDFGDLSHCVIGGED